MALASNTSAPGAPWQAPTFIWLDLTTRCPLACVHCYAGASPRGDHGQMTTATWLEVINQAGALGVGRVIVIGGEPLYHPGCGDVVRHALTQGMRVEIFSSLYRVTPAQWELAALAGVSLACSYYSDDPVQHEAISGRRGSHIRTRANIAESVRRGIPIRVGVVSLTEEQRTEQAMAELAALVPNMCDPQCGPSCSPACRPAGNCRPAGACAPDYR